MTTYASDDWTVYEQKFTHHDQPPKGPGWEPFAVVGNGPTRIMYWRRQKPARKAEPEYRFSPDFIHGAVDRQHLTVARYSGEVRHNGGLIGILHTDRTDEELWAEAKKLLRVQLSTQVVSLGQGRFLIQTVVDANKTPGLVFPADDGEADTGICFVFDTKGRNRIRVNPDFSTGVPGANPGHYLVVWSNEHSSGELPGKYDTEEEAYAAGDEWFESVVAADDDPEEAKEEYSFDVIHRTEL